MTSTRNQGAEHPNVEMTLRLADLLSDALELAVSSGMAPLGSVLIVGYSN